MKCFNHNHILKQSILGVFVIAMFVTPGSISIITDDSIGDVSQEIVGIESHFAYAQTANTGPGGSQPPGTQSSPEKDKAARESEIAKNQGLGGAIATAIGNWLGLTLLGIAAAFTWVGGEFLSYATIELVFEMGLNVNSQFGTAIDVTWGLIRDICNLAFIFGFIYVGISTIIDPQKASTKRTLAQIIIGALLINFSLFIVKFVVDFTNFMAIQIYNAMTVGGGNISLQIASLLGIFEIYNSPTADHLANLTVDGSFWFFVLGAIFLLIAAFVFFMAAVLLAVRFIALVLIMVFSPLLFAATVFPRTQGIASDLWSKLIGYSFFAPIYFLLVLISIRLLEGLEFMRGNNTLMNGLVPVGEMTPQTGTFGVLLYFLIASGFLIATTGLAQKMGMKGGDIAIKFAGGMTYGLAARMGRSTFGQIGHRISEREDLKEAASKRGLGGWTARRALKASRVVGDGSFDLRNTGSAGKALNAGEGRKGGYKTVLGEVKDKEMKFAKSLGEVKDTDPRVNAYKSAADTAEARIKALRDERSTLKPDDVDGKKRIVADINEQEKILRDSRESESREKQRRILGSTNAVDIKKLQEDLAATRKNFNEYKKEKDDVGMTMAKGVIEELEKKLRAAKQQYTGGYAEVLEKSNIFTAWPIGRIVKQERTVGKEMRSEYEKKVKKSKEDARHDALVDAVKAK